MYRRVAGLLFCCVPCAFAQVDSNSVTVTAFRTIVVQPDQASFSVSVTAPVTSTMDDVLAVLQPAGIGLANFSNVYTTYSSANVPMLQWTFSLVGPLTNTKATVATLTNLESSVANNLRYSIAFALQGTGTSAQASQSQSCPLPDLLNEAKAKAQAMASAAGRFVSGLIALATNVPSPPGVGCSVTAKFSLVGF